jgi:isopentenyl-diphosphate delta-isomerase
LALRKNMPRTPYIPRCIWLSSWLFNANGECLITRRALSKKPGPASGPTPSAATRSPAKTIQAIIRRCRFEVGAELTDITAVAPEFRYRETDPSGIVENEICPVFAARITNDVTINEDEVMDYQWVELDALFRALDATPWAFSPWMVMEATTAREKLKAFAAQ